MPPFKKIFKKDATFVYWYLRVVTGWLKWKESFTGKFYIWHHWFIGSNTKLIWVWLILSIAFGNAFCSFYALFKVHICACHFPTSTGGFINIIVPLYKAAKWAFRNLTTIQLATDIEVVFFKKKKIRGRKKEKEIIGLVSLLVRPGRNSGAEEPAWLSVIVCWVSPFVKYNRGFL